MPASLNLNPTVKVYVVNSLLKDGTNTWALLACRKVLRAACRIHDLSNSLLQRICVTKNFLVLDGLGGFEYRALRRLVHRTT